jgi:hypothetical protein
MLIDAETFKPIQTLECQASFKGIQTTSKQFKYITVFQVTPTA